MEIAREETAIQNFYRARHRADVEKILSFLTGKPAELLSYYDVVNRLNITGFFSKGLQVIPLDKIVGSVGRHADFTRSFMPTRDSDKERWLRVQSVVTGPGGTPPIKVYQVAQMYFVSDGNHRVSVARQLGAKLIEAYVTEIQTNIPFAPERQPGGLVIKSEYRQSGKLSCVRCILHHFIPVKFFDVQFDIVKKVYRVFL